MNKIIRQTLTGLILLLTLSNIAFAQSFSDIETDNPYYLATTYLKTKGIINGYADGTFKPFSEINRAELLKILMESSNIKISTPSSNCFKDVPYTAWYAKYVCTAKSQGYVNGYSDGTFKPDQSINKVEAIKMLGEIYQWDLELAKDETIFKDTPENEWYSPYIKYAKMKNILSGSGETYNPVNYITRGSISESIFRLLAIEETNKEVYSTEINNAIATKLGISTISSSTTSSTPSIITLNGIIDDATTGKPIIATASLYDSGDIFITNTTSSSDGTFSLNEIPVQKGDHLIFSKEGYFSLEMPVRSFEDSTIHISLSQIFTTINSEDLRIVLTWGNSETDLDAHLITPKEEIFFMHRISSDIDTILDIDSTKANGTETITIKDLKESQYEFFVHRYSSEKDFNLSNSRVEVYNNNGLAKIYYPPSGEGAIWKVFNLDGQGNITNINKVGGCELINNYTSICPSPSTL